MCCCWAATEYVRPTRRKGKTLGSLSSIAECLMQVFVAEGGEWGTVPAKACGGWVRRTGSTPGAL